MSFLAKTISNKDLKSIPFDQAYRMYMDAADMAEHTLEQERLQQYEEYIARKEQEWADTHEAPYEGNFTDEFPYTPSPERLETRRKAGTAAIVEQFIPRYKLDTLIQAYIMPQIINWITRKPLDIEEMKVDTVEEVQILVDGTYKTTTVEGRKISGKKMFNAIFDRNSEWDMGLFYFLMIDARSAYISGQYKVEGRQYCSLVPLILYAWKLNHSVRYSSWDRNTLHWVVNNSLCQAMLAKLPEDLTRDDILVARAQGLVYKSGTKAGQSRNPVSTYKLYDLHGTKLMELPELARTMLAQIWCAHPSNRTKYMVLDPINWDSIPTPLITDQIFVPQPAFDPKPKKPVTYDDNPW